MEDLPQPPSPQMVIVIRWGSEEEDIVREGGVVERVCGWWGWGWTP
jgi:hypothetical protein